MNREELIATAVALNEAYRSTGEQDLELDLGFLMGTAEMVTTLTLGPDESYHDVREELAHVIDAQASVTTYRMLVERN